MTLRSKWGSCNCGAATRNPGAIFYSGMNKMMPQDYLFVEELNWLHFGLKALMVNELG
jgi:hypothetical protein